MSATSRIPLEAGCIFENKNQPDIPAVFAGLLTIILIGLLVENVVFRTLENRTVRRWGMQH